MEFLTYFILYGIVPLMISILYGLAIIVPPSLLEHFIEINNLPEYIFNIDIILLLWVIFLFVSGVIIALKINNAVFNKYKKVNISLFGIIISFSSVLFYVSYLFFCSISMLVKCEVKSYLSIWGIAQSINIHILTTIVFAMSVIKFKSKNKLAYYFLMIVLIIAIGYLSSANVLPAEIKSYLTGIAELNKNILIANNLKNINFNRTQFPGTNISFETPSSYTSKDGFYLSNIEEHCQVEPSDCPYSNYNFRYYQTISYESSVDKNTNFLNFLLKITNTSSPIKSFSAYDFINDCGRPVTFGTDSEKCRTPKDIKLLPNGVEYCETYNLDHEEIKKSSIDPISKWGANVIENRNRVFIARLGNSNNHCLILTISAEPRNTKEKAIQNIASYLLSTIKY